MTTKPSLAWIVVLYSCTHMATVGVKGLELVNILMSLFLG